MRDGCGRAIDYLRISVTDRCNLRCLYCMPENGVPSLSHEDILSYEEITELCQVAAGLGITKLKLTGGEPLLRKDLASLIARLKAVEGIRSVTLTTNGILLKSQLPGLLDAGLDGVNISLDTLDSSKYTQITRRGRVEDALSGLFAALDALPRLRVKVNCVPYFSDRENLTAMAGLARKYPVHVRFIEMMPIGLGRRCGLCREQEVIEVLTKAYGPMTFCDAALGNGPCHYYSIDGFLGKIGFISAISHKFCSSCNRVRLSADGYLKACLQYDTGVSLKALLREGAPREALASAMKSVIYNKPVSHHFEGAVSPLQNDEQLSMFQIGG